MPAKEVSQLSTVKRLAQSDWSMFKCLVKFSNIIYYYYIMWPGLGFLIWGGGGVWRPYSLFQPCVGDLSPVYPLIPCRFHPNHLDSGHWYFFFRSLVIILIDSIKGVSGRENRIYPCTFFFRLRPDPPPSPSFQIRYVFSIYGMFWSHDVSYIVYY